MKLNKKYIAPLTLFVVGLGIILFTNPQHLSPVLLILPLLIFTAVIYWTLLLIGEQIKSFTSQKLRKKTKLNLILIVAVPALLILLQSIGQLTFRDIITLGLIVAVLVFYVSKVSFGRG